MYSSATWLERYRNRYQWAVRAYDQFVRELAPELLGSLQRSDKITVVVYGATQVGKTTLILDLLGLNTLTSNEVAMVLRGGQQIGKSATAMPIRYGRSLDDHWYIATDGPMTAEQACERLGRVRYEVESGGIRDAEVLDIRIPTRLFPADEDKALSLELNIIDIPGINSRNEDERRLVANLARRYVSVADLVLLVGRADSLGFLNETDLQIEALADWAAQPSRFRIVLTFSFSPDSLYQQFMVGELTCERVRDVLIAEMQTHDYHFPPEFRANLFMLELGDSVRALQRNNPRYCERIVQITRRFREELLGNISQSAGPYARLYSAFQLDRVINARIERLQQLLQEQEAELLACKSRALEQLAEYRPRLANGSASDIQEAANEVHLQLLELKKKLEQLQACRRSLEAFNCAKKFEYPVGMGEERVSWLKKRLEEAEQYQRQMCQNAPQWLEQNGLIPDWCPENVPVLEYKRTELMAIETYLDDYSLDKYWLSSNFNLDRENLQKALNQSASEHGKRLKALLNTALQTNEKSLKTSSDDLASQRWLMEVSLANLRSVAQQELQLKDQHAIELKRMEDSAKLVSHFEARLNEAFVQELRATRQAAYNHPNATQRFYGLLHARMLLSEIGRMYQGRKF